MDNIDFTKFTEYLLLIQKAFENTSEGVAIADVNGYDMPLVYVNKAFERITGYCSEEVLGKNCRFLQGEDRSQQALDIVRRSIREGTECTVTLRNYKKNGTLFYNKLRISPIYDSNNMLSHFVGIQTDITDIFLAQSEFERSNSESKLSNADLYELIIQTIQNIRIPLSKTYTTLSNLQKLLVGNVADKVEMEIEIKNIEKSISSIIQEIDNSINDVIQ